jgi:hypothetical protein
LRSLKSSIASDEIKRDNSNTKNININASSTNNVVGSASGSNIANDAISIGASANDIELGGKERNVCFCVVDKRRV